MLCNTEIVAPRFQNMMIMFLAVFGVSCGFASVLQSDVACYGDNYLLPSKPFINFSRDSVYFASGNSGPRKLLLDKGKPVDSRVNISSGSFWLLRVTNKDKGTFVVSSERMRLEPYVMLNILDCAENIIAFYADSLERNVPTDALLLDYIPRESLGKPVTLWNRTDPRSGGGRRGNVTNNVWRISNLTQADNGLYNFRLKNNTVISKILLTVKGNTHHCELNESQFLIISYPPFGGPWTVIFQPENHHRSETLVRKGRRVYGTLKDHWTIQTENHILIENAKWNDSGTLVFTDPQDNVALTVQLKVNTAEVKNHSILTYVVVCVVFVVVGICCCYCCGKKCCKKDSSTPKTEAVAPAVYYHDAPPTTVPNYSGPVYPSAYPHQPGDQPINTNPPPPVIIVNPPPYMNPNPIPPGINLSPPSPGITMNPLQTEGPPAAPTFNSDFLSSDSEPRFELTGFSVPFARPLNSDIPVCDVYNSNKLNF